MAEELGELLVTYDNAAENDPVEAFRVRTNRVSGGAIAPTDWSKINYRPRLMSNAWVDEGGFIKLAFKADAADTVESEESDMMMPVLLKNKRTGVVSSRILGTKDLDAFKSTGTDDVVNSTTVFVHLGKFVVPTGFWAKVDGSQVFHAFIGDDT